MGAAPRAPEPNGGVPAPVSQLGLLRSRRFWPLFTVQFLGAFNDQAFKTGFVALLTWRLAADKGLGGALDMLNQLAAALFILPFALISPTAGMIADGIDKAVMMRWVKAAEIGLMLLAAAAFRAESVTALFLLLLLMGAQSAFFAPIKYAVLPRYLRPEELVAGNGLVAAATFIAIICGQIVGAKLALIGGIGPFGGALGIETVSGLVIVVAIIGWLAALCAPPVPPVGPRPGVDWLLPRAMIRVLRECARWREPWFAVLAFAWFWLAGAAVLAFVPPMARETLHGTEDVALILLVTFTLGVSLGAMLCNRVLRGRASYRPVPWGALGMMAGLLLLHPALAAYGGDIPAGAPLLSGAAFLSRADAWPVLGCFLLMSSFAGLYVVPLSVIYQTTSPEPLRARIVAASNVIDSLAMVVSALLATALLLAGLDRAQVLVAFALTGLPVALVIALHHRRGPDLSPPAAAAPPAA
ncbi:MAG: MFS transporter [Alphaproteobacteria bacterium]|nr:MAG: MFS transporter [Alphaproteobacteria bacterium]